MTNTIKVAICDDHFFYRQGIRNWLENKPNIDIVGESEDGLKLLKSLSHISPDIILLDINMPVMDGHATLKVIRETYPNIKVIMLTMNDSPYLRTEMFKIGANAYLTKNDDAELIYEAIMSCMSNGFFFRDKDTLALVDTVKDISHGTFVAGDTPINKIEKKENKINYLKIVGISAVLIVLGILFIYFMGTLNNNLSHLKEFNY
jgi:DNA-binding NarL/FixJ family response regulator